MPLHPNELLSAAKQSKKLPNMFMSAANFPDLVQFEANVSSFIRFIRSMWQKTVR